MVFQGHRKTGHVDLEAIETVVRSAMHRVGAAALANCCVSRPSCPTAEPSLSLRAASVLPGVAPKPILSTVGTVIVSQPYYLCPHCHTGKSPADVELDMENSESSPGVRRMQALVGQNAPFDHGREQMKMLAGLEVTTKAVERTAEAIGDHIVQNERQEIQRAVQLDLPLVIGQPVPLLYVQMDGTGVPVVKKETEGRKGKIEGQPAHTREAKLGCVFTQTGWDQEGDPIHDPDSTHLHGSHRKRRGVRQAALHGSLEARLEPSGKESFNGRRGGVDLESSRTAFSWRASDRRSLSRAPRPMGRGALSLS